MTWTPPATLDEFRILRPLGAGAMGQVFLAYDTLLDREVAIKFIAGIEIDAGMRDRFFTEARAVARLSHPNVVAIHRVGELKQRPYLVSEYVPGVSLASVTKPLPWQRAVRIATGLARGLGAAHRRGVLHRDIKPANVVLGSDDEAKLLDFGLAKLVGQDDVVRPQAPITVDAALDATMSIADRIAPTVGHDERVALTADGALVGTPLYLSPERWRGEPASPRSDVYALGVVLYELLAGRVPHLTTGIADLEAHVTAGDPAPIARHIASLPSRLASLVDACVAHSPERRPATGDELCDALEALQPSQLVNVEEPPYRGLSRFEPEHRGVFFGRLEESREIVERLRTETLVIVAGDSGAGKSSLCRAAVLPAVSEKSLGGRSWRITTMVPGTHPSARLTEALAMRGPGEGLLLFIDQLEELLTIADLAEANAMAERIADLAVAGSHVRVLATVRSDFLGRLAGLPHLGELVGRALYLLGPLGDRGLRDAIVGPARAHGYQFASPAMIDELVASGRRHLPLLQFTLSELWNARDAATQTIPSDALDSIGGVAGALARRADQVMASLGGDDRKIAWRVFVRLTTAEGTRAVMSRRELSEVVGDVDAVDRIVERLVAARLLSPSPDGDDRVEVVHESLFSSWPALLEWRRSHEEGARMRDTLAEAARRWHERGRPRGLVWRGDALAEYRRWRRRWPERMTGVEAGFADACESEARRTRRLRVFALSLLISVLSIGILVLYRSDRRAATERDVAESRRQEAELQRRMAYFEQGLQELSRGRASRAMPFLLQAMREGDTSPAMRFALGEATRPLELEISTSRALHDGVVAIVWHPDGKRVAVTGSAGEVMLFDARGRMLRAYAWKEPMELRPAFSVDGSRLLGFSKTGRIEMWDVETGEFLREFAAGTGRVLRTTLDQTRLVVTTIDGVYVWDSESGGLRYKVTRPARASAEVVCDHAVTADGSKLLVGFGDGAVTVYELASGRVLSQLAATSRVIAGCRLGVSPDGKWLAVTATSTDLFDLTTYRRHVSLPFSFLSHPGVGEYSIAFSPDSKWLAIGSEDGVARIWDIETGNLAKQLLGHQNYIASVSFSADGSRLATSSNDWTFRIWDTHTGVQEMVFEAAPTSPGRGTALAIAATFSGDGGTLVAAAGNELRWFRVARDSLAHDVEIEGLPSSARLSPDERRVATAGLRGNIDIVDLSTHATINSKVVTESLWDVGWNADASRLAVSGRNGFAAILDAKSLAVVHQLIGHEPASSVNRVTYSPDARFVVTAGGDHTARIWDANTGDAAGVIRQPGPVMSAVWSPDQTLIATADWNHAVRIWDSKSLAQLAEFRASPLRFLDVVFSPDSKHVVGTTHAGVVAIWDIATGQRLMTLLGHSGPVTSAVFSPGGTFLATSSSDGTARVWDVTTGRQLAQRLHGDEALQVTWNHAGTQLVVATPSPGLRIWDVTPERRTLSELEEFAASRVPWKLTNGRLEVIDR